MKAFIALAALAAANIAGAAPQTIYFAGNIYDGTVLDVDSRTWVQTPTGGAFSGSITIDGANGGQPSGWSFSGAPGVDLMTFGLVDNPVVLSYAFNYNGFSYTRPSPTASDFVYLAKWVSGQGVWGQPDWEPRNGNYEIEISHFDELESNEDRYAAYNSKRLNLFFGGPTDFSGYLSNYSTLPSLDRFDPSASGIRFSNDSYSCQFVSGFCKPGTTVYGPNNVDLLGRITYLGTAPMASAELPEPGSLALLAAGLLGLAGTRRKAR